MCNHPHIDDRLLVFPEIGKADYAFTASVLSTISPPHNGVQLARYTRENLRTLQQQIKKFSHGPISDIVEAEEDIMDWRCPVRILDTEKVIAMDGAAFVKIRNKVRKAGQNITCTPLEPDNGLRAMKAVLKFWEGNMILHAKDTEDMPDLYLELLKIIGNYPDNIHGLIFYKEKRPVGFTIWDKPYGDTANIFVNLGDTAITGLSDFQVVSTCRHLYDEGIKYINMGGSELESLDAFKAKFQPAKTIEIFSADVIYHKPENTNIEICTIVQPPSCQPFFHDNQDISPNMTI